MSSPRAPQFDQHGLAHLLTDLDDSALDALGFGVIAFDAASRVQRYNRSEEACSGIARELVIGEPLFTDVAQCLNNYLVAQRYEDAAQQQQPLDVVLPFTLTWRMRPTPVQLRLLWAPGLALRYLALRWEGQE